MSSRIVEYCCCSPRCKSSFYSSFAPLIVQSKQLVQAGVVGGRPSQANDKDVLCAHTYLQRRYCNILVVHAAAAYSTTNCPNYPQDWKKSIPAVCCIPVDDIHGAAAHKEYSKIIPYVITPCIYIITVTWPVRDKLIHA